VNVAILLDLVADLDGDRVLVKADGRPVTAQGLRLAARALAGRLRAFGSPGSVIAFLGVNGPAVPIALFACAYADRVFAPLNYRADADLLRHFATVLEPAAVLAEDRYAPAIRAAAAEVPVIAVEAGQWLASRPDTAGEAPGTASGPAVIIFTSGTTSRPKPIRLQHQNLMSYVLETAEALQEPPSAASLVAAPTYHIAAVSNILTSIYSGRRIVFLEEFSAQRWLSAIDDESVTHAFVVPTMLYRIVRELGVHPRKLASLRTLAYGGGRSDPQVVRAAVELMPHVDFVQAYGLTETSSTVTILEPSDHRLALASDDPRVRARLRSVGRPVAGTEVRIADNGEVLIRGARVQRADGTDDGWLHTGDLGWLDENGYLFLTDRIDDMIIRGGENISPSEVEDVLKGQPGVRDAAVVGVSDPEWGQRVVAAVETDGAVEPARLAADLRTMLPSFKCPEQVIVVDALPRNDLGKLRRAAVRDWFTGKVGPASAVSDGE
jgi:fatty-acyl-CoA synthase